MRRAARGVQVSEHFAPLEAMAPPDDDPASDPLALVLLSSEVVDGLAAAAPRLRYIYDFYLQEQELGDSQIEWSKLLDVKSKMPLPAFSQFCTDFEIVPQLVSRIKATEAFKLCKFKAEKEAGTINTRISFQGRAGRLHPTALHRVASTRTLHAGARELYCTVLYQCALHHAVWPHATIRCISRCTATPCRAHPCVGPGAYTCMMQPLSRRSAGSESVRMRHACVRACLQSGVTAWAAARCWHTAGTKRW